LLKVIAPGVIFFMLVTNVARDAGSNFNNYPAWANGIFGWFFCVTVPVGVMVYGMFWPMDLDSEGDGGDGVHESLLGGGARSSDEAPPLLTVTTPGQGQQL
jgi:hypothetical protein